MHVDHRSRGWFGMWTTESSCWHANDGQGLETKRFRNAFGGWRSNRPCAARLGQKLPSVQRVAKAVPALASGIRTNIANTFLHGVRSGSSGAESTLMETDAKVLRLPIVLAESSGLFSNCSVTGGGPERFTIDGSRQSDTVALFPALVVWRTCVSTWCLWRGDGRTTST